MTANMMERMVDCGWMPMIGIGIFFMILFWVVLTIGVVVATRWFIGQGPTRMEDSALEILKKRYARGEINKQEFEDRKRDLMD